MNKVLIALDYDPTAQKVAEKGYSFAKAMGAEVYLLHVLSDAAYYSSRSHSAIMGFDGYTDIDPLQGNLIELLRQSSTNFLTQTKKHLSDEEIKTIIKEGDFADTILETAHELHADTIVMGSHSRKWLEKIMMGSVAEKVLHHTDTPLLIIPTKSGK